MTDKEQVEAVAAAVNKLADVLRIAGCVVTISVSYIAPKPQKPSRPSDFKKD